MCASVPADVAEVIEFIGQVTKGYNGRLNWRERGRIQRDMVNDPDRWRASRVTPEALYEKCLEVGLKAEDATLFADFLRKAQAGKQMRPRYIEKDWRYFPNKPTGE